LKALKVPFESLGPSLDEKTFVRFILKIILNNLPVKKMVSNGK
jgi:hypothetical protein